LPEVGYEFFQVSGVSSSHVLEKKFVCALQTLSVHVVVHDAVHVVVHAVVHVAVHVVAHIVVHHMVHVIQVIAHGVSDAVVAENVG
jgi:hypothetical protein